MSVWIRNFTTALENREVVILHGNVRDKYISSEGNIIYDNLTSLIKEVSKNLPLRFSRITFYDVLGREVWEKGSKAVASKRAAYADSDLGATGRETDARNQVTPERLLQDWKDDLLTGRSENTLATIFYLDKLVSFRENANYTSEDRLNILRLEKIIENITPNNRLIMVALRDGMIPIEFYTNSPKTQVLPIPIPDKRDREAYLKHRLGDKDDRPSLVGDLTDGLFLRDLDNISRALGNEPRLSSKEMKRIVNRYRIGEQEDRWGTLDINKLASAEEWFTEGRKEVGSDKRMGGGVKGQGEAVRKIADTLRLARAGLSGMASGVPSKPKGVLFFAGPTGVGKTFLARKLAEFLFDTEEAFIRFDMSEFKEEHTDSKLIGSPPGYVGYERGGLLTNAVRERPFSVILFDEIEKAHPRILDIFLQMLDEGRLTDSRGQTVFFTETVIIFTSNIGTRTRDSRDRPILEKALIDDILTNENLSQDERKQRIRGHFVKAAEDFFMHEISRPELLNRIGDNIVAFNYIDTADVQKQIVESHFKRIRSEFDDRFKGLGYTLELADSVADHIVKEHSERLKSFGGRATTAAIEKEIMTSLAVHLLKAEHNESRGVVFRVAVRDGKIVMES